MNNTLFLIKPPTTKGIANTLINLRHLSSLPEDHKTKPHPAQTCAFSKAWGEPERGRRFNEEQGNCSDPIKALICSNLGRVSSQIFEEIFDSNTLRPASAEGCAARCAHTDNLILSTGVGGTSHEL